MTNPEYLGYSTARDGVEKFVTFGQPAWQASGLCFHTENHEHFLVTNDGSQYSMGSTKADLVAARNAIDQMIQHEYGGERDE